MPTDSEKKQAKASSDATKSKRSTTKRKVNAEHEVDELGREYVETNKPRRKGQGGNGNFPQLSKTEKPQDIQQALGAVMRWYKQPKCTSDEEVAERTEQYFTTCMEQCQRPTVESYALSLGVTRTMLNYWKNGRYCSEARTDLINQVYEMLAAFDAEMAITNKMQPVPYIFRAKNYYGMRDQTEVTLGPAPTEAEKTPEQLEEYLNIVDAD